MRLSRRRARRTARCGSRRRVWLSWSAPNGWMCATITLRASSMRVPAQHLLLHLPYLLYRCDQTRAVLGNELRELRRVHIGDGTARGLEGLYHLRAFDSLRHRFAQPRHDRRGKTGLREQPGPDVELDVLVAELLECRQIGKTPNPIRTPVRQHAHFAVIDLLLERAWRRGQ